MAGEEAESPSPDAVSLFASRLSHHRFGDEDLRVLEAATSPRCSRLLRARLRPGGRCRGDQALMWGRGLAVGSCLAMGYEALVLRAAKYSDDLDLLLSYEEWLAFAKDSLDNGFYTIASKVLANALVHIHPSHLGYLDSTNSILKKDRINYIRGLQNLAKSLSALRSGDGSVLSL